MRNKVILFFCLLPMGCTHFSVTQREIDANGVERSTKTSATTFFDSKSELAKLRASTTDKTQSTSVGSLNAETSGSNAVDMAGQILGTALRAATRP